MPPLEVPEEATSATMDPEVTEFTLLSDQQRRIDRADRKRRHQTVFIGAGNVYNISPWEE